MRLSLSLEEKKKTYQALCFGLDTHESPIKEQEVETLGDRDICKACPVHF